MQIAVKIVFTVLIVLGATELGKKLPSIAGLIATMPLTSLMVMIWLSIESPDKAQTMISYSSGAFWGVIPSMMFFGAASLCYQRGMALPSVIAISFVVWIAGAGVHILVLGGK